ncbi:hypothetical protein EAH78_22865 [Pseudomonas arsenicoxydans]|uniref:Uncharacterized protein n=1 Tax=Pseudomonas arsenicoxydans TaxID=702115 RepID=A0A502HJF7_9PSED|nr:hypothetical protein EAH78_22865 [Pseudomonas arsenicoxydans]
MWEPLWRGGLPPLGSEAAPAFRRQTALIAFTAATQPNGGKPPRHKGSLPQGAACTSIAQAPGCKPGAGAT